jgi:hypothetical protein
VLKRIVGYRRERVIKEHRKNNNNNENWRRVLVSTVHDVSEVHALIVGDTVHIHTVRRLDTRFSENTEHLLKSKINNYTNFFETPKTIRSRYRWEDNNKVNLKLPGVGIWTIFIGFWTRPVVRSFKRWSEYLCPIMERPRGLRHEPSPPALTLGSWVRIPFEAWISMCIYSVFVLFCV